LSASYRRFFLVVINHRAARDAMLHFEGGGSPDDVADCHGCGIKALLNRFLKKTILCNPRRGKPPKHPAAMTRKGNPQTWNRPPAPRWGDQFPDCFSPNVVPCAAAGHFTDHTERRSGLDVEAHSIHSRSHGCPTAVPSNPNERMGPILLKRSRARSIKRRVSEPNNRPAANSFGIFWPSQRHHLRCSVLSSL